MQTIILDPWEVLTAQYVASRLAAETAKQTDTFDYAGKSGLESNEDNSLRVCLSEMAVAKATGRYWSPRFWDSNLHTEMNARFSDVSGGIGVRNVRSYRKPIAVKKKDLTCGDKFIVGTYLDLSEPHIVYTPGFLSVEEAWCVGIPDSSYKRVAWDRFKPLKVLHGSEIKDSVDSRSEREKE